MNVLHISAGVDSLHLHIINLTLKVVIKINEFYHNHLILTYRELFYPLIHIAHYFDHELMLRVI